MKVWLLISRNDRNCFSFVLAVPESQDERDAAIAASDKFCGLTFGGVSEWGCRDVALSHVFNEMFD